MERIGTKFENILINLWWDILCKYLGVCFYHMRVSNQGFIGLPYIGVGVPYVYMHVNNYA